MHTRYRMFVHLADSTKQGHNKVLLRIVVTNVVVLATTAFVLHVELENISCFSVSTTSLKRLGNINLIRCLFFHGFTGCDSVLLCRQIEVNCI